MMFRLMLFIAQRIYFRARTQAKTMRFLVETIGSDGRPALEAELAVETRPDIRAAIERTLAQLTGR